jgi:ABC-2 type transport system permease protein
MRAFTVLLRMRLFDVLRNRSTAGFLLVFPIVLLAMVGLVFMHGHPFETQRVALAGESVILDRARATLEGRPHLLVLESARDEDAAVRKLRARMLTAVLVASPGSDQIRIVIGANDTLFAHGLDHYLRQPATIEVVPIPRWGYVHFLFPGILTLSVMVSGLFALGYSLVVYRQSGFLKKLATTPLPRRTFVAAQIVARGSLIVVQAAILLAVAALAFALPLDAVALGIAMLVTVLGTITFMGMGFALACAVRTEDLMADIIGAANLPLVLLSEIFFPLDALPRPLAMLGAALPSTQMVRLCREALLYGVSDVPALLPGLGVMTLWGAVSFAVAVLVFRWH